MIALVISQLKKLESIFSQNLPFKLIAASVLIIYEGDVDSKAVTHDYPSIEDTMKKFEAQDYLDMKSNKVAEFRMIDFAHVIIHKEPQPDVGIVTGLRNLIKYLTEIAEEADKSTANL